jgi:hypothetical protein
MNENETDKTIQNTNTYSNKYLNTNEVIVALKNFKVSNNTHTSKISNPKGGDSYMYYVEDEKKHNDWKCDGYKWFNNGANKKVSPYNPILICTYYYALLAGKSIEIGKGLWFKKRVFRIIDKPDGYPNPEPFY